jgi:hypothetical protein
MNKHICIFITALALSLAGRTEGVWPCFVSFWLIRSAREGGV